VAEIPVGLNGAGWKAALRRLALDARTVVLRHTWAPRLIEAGAEPGPATLRIFDTAMRILREGGFSIDQTHHAVHILGSRLLGFTQDLFDDSDDLDPEAASNLAGELGDTFPYVAEMALAVTHDGGLGGCDDDVEFEVGLDLILDGLERLRDA
jgi:hypothetical protein